jgi:deoxyribose-phosphate aldolase
MSTPTSVRTLQDSARIALACLDLTTLGDHDSDTDVLALCQRAQSPHGPVAAVCVWPGFANLARQHLPAGIAVAAVANFPDGGTDPEAAARDAAEIVDAGAQEVDVVLPYAALMRGDEAVVAAVLAATRKASQGVRLKVILETGELKTEALIRRAAHIALSEGADFLKTSTGKTPVGATLDAARLLLQAIAHTPGAAGRVGFKPSGGIRTVAEAEGYIALTESILGGAALHPSRLRFGASSLLNDIAAVLAGTAPPPVAAPGSY